MSDLISRKAAIEAMSVLNDSICGQQAIDALCELPSAQTERKKGRWIYYDSDSDRYDKIGCPVCWKRFTVDAERWCDIGFVVSDLNYCPNCGARMQEGDGDETD